MEHRRYCRIPEQASKVANQFSNKMNPSSSCSRSPVRRVAFIIGVAVLYGVILAASGMLMAGSGDGSYVLLGFYSAPISALGYVLYLFEKPGVLLAVIGTPLLWAVAGIFGTIADRTKRRVCLGAFLIAHYSGAILVSLQTEPYGNWRKLHEQWGFAACKVIIIFSLTIYLLGQMWLWRQFFRSFGSKDPQGQIFENTSEK